MKISDIPSKVSKLENDSKYVNETQMNNAISEIVLESGQVEFEDYIFGCILKYDNQIGFIFGRRSSGYFDIRKLDGTKINASASYKKLKLIETRKNYITERKGMAIPHIG